MNLITKLIDEIQRQDRVNDLDLSGVVEILHEANNAYNKALAISRVVGRSEQLPCDKCENGLIWSKDRLKGKSCDCGK